MFLSLLLTGTRVPAQTGAVLPAALEGKIDLAEVIRFALEHNFAIRQARARIRAQEGVITAVSAAGLPAVSAPGLYQRSNTPTLRFPTGAGGGLPVFVPIGGYWRFILGFQQTPYAGGGVQAARRGATLTRDAAVDKLRSVVDRTLLDIKTRFYVVLLAREQIKVQDQNLQLLETELHDARNRYQAGAVSQFEFLRAEVAVANAKAPLITARNNHRLAIEELRGVLGAALTDRKDAPPDTVEELGFEPVTADLRSALAAAARDRPELLRLRKLQEAATALVRSARQSVAQAGMRCGSPKCATPPARRHNWTCSRFRWR
jgi:outer membrane protein TolC